jgi:fatty-acyl-CoA synthase
VDTIATFLRARADDPAPGLRFEDETWSYRDLVAGCAQRAAYLLERKPTDPGRPFHVGVLLDNVPEFWLLLGAAALSGATIVGINPTRRGAELARDIGHTDCAFLVTESNHLELLDGAGLDGGMVSVIDEPDWAKALAPHEGAALADVDANVAPRDLFMLIFTSGTTGAPKAVKMGHGRLAIYGERLSGNAGLTATDVCYSVMPLFHSNAMVAGYSAPLCVGATTVLRRRFSASAFLPDVRRYGVTWFNYVGKPLTYILATPEQPDDADNPLRIAFGNEAAPLDIDRFARRFGCFVIDGYGSTEGGVNMSRTPETPPGSLGMPIEGLNAAICNQDTGAEAPRAVFDEHGRLLNAEEAIGEIVNPDGAGGFEGYYNNAEANAQRMRDGKYWTGDLGYRDEAGFFYFAGRDTDWLRVDGENFAAAPVENVIARHDNVVIAAVYAVPSPDVGDDVMVSLHVRDVDAFDADEFCAWFASQSDASPKWLPKYVRVTDGLPSTQTQKVLKRVLRREHWESEDPVWWRPERGESFRLLTSDDRRALRETFAQRNREHLLGRA